MKKLWIFIRWLLVMGDDSADMRVLRRLLYVVYGACAVMIIWVLVGFFRN